MSKVLLVDNETTRVKAIREALERGGFETVSAADGNEALQTFLNEVPDLVMVGPLAADPDENFCHRMRETRPGTTIPILLYCESLGGEELKAALERSGCNVYVELPASDERLIEVCRHALLESVDPGPGAAPEAVATADTPAFASPGAALAELETSGSDIDAHLEALFETGEAPQWDAVTPAPSLEADIPERSLGPAIPEPGAETMATMAEEAVSPADAEAPEDLDSDRDLVGFQPDAVSFESEGELNPGIQPEIACEAESLIKSPYGSPGPDVDQPAAFDSTDTTDDAASAGSLDLDPEEAPVAEGTSFSDMRAAEPPPSSSRGWLWGVVAVAAMIGGIGLFLFLRPSPADDSGSANLASMRPATSTPTIPAATESGTVVVDVDPAVAEAPEVVPAFDAAETSETVDGPVAEVNDPVVAIPEDPADVPDDGAAVAAVAADPGETADETGGDTMVAEAMDTVPAAATSPDEAPVAPKPVPSAGVVFEPSTEIVDAATAGEGFTAPRSINRSEPTYNPEDVPEGGETVVLRVLVNDWGKAVRVDIEAGRAQSPLVDAAIDVVLNTRYYPAEDGGRQVRAWTTETFEFEKTD